MKTDKDEKVEKEKKTPKKEKTIKVKESEYQKIVDELAEYKDKYVRLFAEFDNARKRMDREKQDFIKFANEGVMSDLLEVLDNLERSVQAASEKHEDYEGFIKGIELIMAQFYELLKKNGVEPIETTSKKFDPNCHEVLLQAETDEVEEGTVMEEFQKGYLLGGKVLRTAKVKIAKKKE